VDGEELEGGSEDARGRSMDGEELRHQGTRLGREHRGRIEMGRRWRVGWPWKGARTAGEERMDGRELRHQGARRVREHRGHSPGEGAPGADRDGAAARVGRPGL